MNVKVIKRLEALENAVNKTEIPELIMVTFNDNVDEFVFREDYFKRDSNGRVTIGGYSKTNLKKHYRDYVFAGNVHATVIFLAIFNDDEHISISFKTDDLRRMCALSADTAFYINNIKNSDVNRTEAEVSICVYKSSDK